MTVRAYLLTTGVVFALIALAHVARVAAESAALARDPFFVLTTVLSLALCGWAVRLLRLTRRA